MKGNDLRMTDTGERQPFCVVGPMVWCPREGEGPPPGQYREKMVMHPQPATRARKT